MSVLALDIGKKRIGLAGCNPLGITARTLPAIHRKSLQEVINQLERYCIQRNVKGLIIGIPLSEEGLETKQSKHCKTLGKQIAKALSLPIAWVNEHSSTWEAANIYNLNGDKSGKLDSAAALLLIKQWLQEGPELKRIQHLAEN